MFHPILSRFFAGGRFFPLFGLLLCTTPKLFSQQYTTAETTAPKARTAYEDGRYYSQKGDLFRALRAYEYALRIDSNFIEARLSWAEANLDTGHWSEAESGFEAVLRLNPNFHPAISFNLALAEWRQDKFEEAQNHIDNFLASGVKDADILYKAQRLAENCRFAADAVRHPVPFEPHSLGPGVNTKFDEYLPCLTADGQTLIFSRRDMVQGPLGPSDDENFYISQYENGVWQPARFLEGVNTAYNEGAQAISPDGSWLVFTGCDRRGDGSQGSCDIYWSQQKNGAWTKPVPFSAVINSRDYDTQPCISADGKSLIFASNRPGSLGGTDLWITTRQPDGKWTIPENLGPNINTPADDECPFLHPDGQTLYFSSQGWPGMGDFDFYFARKNPDGTWGKAQNLGYPINTKGLEKSMVVSLDGRTAYFSAIRDGGAGGVDIYSFDLPLAARPQAVTYARAKVRDAATGNALVAKVEFTDLKTGQVFVSARTKSDGTFLVCLPAGKDYALNVSKEKYLFFSENFNLLETASFEQPFTMDISLQPIGESESTADAMPPANSKPVVLRNVFFETGSAALLSESTNELDRLTALLTETPGLHIQISGHTDNVGDESSNQMLSENRAKAVYDYLIQHGIPAARLRYKGFGETKPVDTNDTPEGRARNRRTEFIVW